MTGGSSAVSAFRARVEVWPEVWQAVDVRSLCFKAGSEWVNALCQVRLFDLPPEECPRIEGSFSNDKFAILQETSSPSRVGGLLDGLERNEITVAGVRVGLYRLDSDRRPSPYTYSFDTVQRRWSRDRNYVQCDYQTYFLYGYGDTLSGLIPREEIEQASTAIMANPVPYGGLTDVAQALFGATYHYEASNAQSCISFVAPCYMHIKSVEDLREGSLTTKVQVPRGVKGDAFALNVISRPIENPTVRKQYPILGVPPSLEARIPVDHGSKIEIYLLYRGEPVDFAEYYLPVAGTPNPRLQAHLLFDEAAKRLHEFLFPAEPFRLSDSRISDMFEIGVAWLLHVCGFTTVPYGLRQGKLDEEVDILAFVPFSRSLLAVECTTAEIRPDKILKLARRCEQLGSSLPGFEILPAIATPRTPTEGERKTAHQNGVRVVDRDRLGEALVRAQDNAAPSEIFALLTSTTTFYGW